jgi:hypothetical protein
VPPAPRINIPKPKAETSRIPTKSVFIRLLSHIFHITCLPPRQHVFEDLLLPSCPAAFGRTGRRMLSRVPPDMLPFRLRRGRADRAEVFCREIEHTCRISALGNDTAPVVHIRLSNLLPLRNYPIRYDPRSVSHRRPSTAPSTAFVVKLSHVRGRARLCMIRVTW